MKTVKFLTFAAIAVLTLVACEKKDDEPKPNITIENNAYAGKLTVIFDGQPNIQDYDGLEVIKTDKVDSIILFFKQIKFVSQMPGDGFDIKIPVEATSTPDFVALSGTKITPYLAGAEDTPYPNFSINNVEGKLDNDSLIFSTDIEVITSMGPSLPKGLIMPTSFAGKAKK
ncbi:MAG: hypothetical protein LBB41_03380 [Prevotellaceae bacterium]|jgi:hypothetical protein|nr:hypothetical protein [Prevotellaceae bacterium]